MVIVNSENLELVVDAVKNKLYFVLLITMFLIIFESTYMPAMAVTVSANQAATSNFKPGEFWRRSFSSPIIASYLTDFNQDNRTEIIVVTAYNMTVLSERNIPLFSYSSTKPIVSSFLCNLDNDPFPEILISTSEGYLTLLEMGAVSFFVEWTSKIGFGTPAYAYDLVDLNNDGSPEIVLAARNYRIYAFLSNNGTQILETPVSTPTVHLAHIDVQLDGRPEILVATEDSYINYISYTGTVTRWFARPGVSFYDILVDDVNHDGIDEGYSIASDGILRAHRFDGSLVWSEDLGYNATHIMTVDYNNDGIKEILVYGTNDASLVDAEGNLLWHIHYATKIYSLTPLNFDYDSGMEFALLLEGLNITILDSDASKLFSYTLFNMPQPTKIYSVNFDSRFNDVLDEIFTVSTTLVSVIGIDEDGDGLLSVEENLIYHTNPLKADTDGDEISDYDEIFLGLNATVPDVDGDGIPDGLDVFEGYNDYYVYLFVIFVLIGAPSIAIFRAHRKIKPTKTAES